MRRSRLPLLLCIAAYLAFAAPAHAITPTYEFVDLGAEFKPTAINNQRQIVGSYGAQSRGAWWNNGAPQYLSSLETVQTVGPSANPVDINASGVIVGLSWTDGGGENAGWWQYGSSTPHTAGVALGTKSRASSINAFGSIIGTSTSNGVNSERVQITAPGASTATTLVDEGVPTHGCGISDAGEILVLKQGVFGLLDNALDTTVTPLPGIAAGCISHAMGADGTVVGKNPSGIVSKRNPGSTTVTPLEDSIPADITSYSVSAVNAGIVVGAQTKTDSSVEAFGFFGGPKVRINTLLPTNLFSSAATDVNENGDIVGWANDYRNGGSGTPHGFLLKNTAVVDTPPPTNNPPTNDSNVLPPAANPVSRLFAVDNPLKDGTTPKILVTRGGKTYTAGPGATFQIGDVIKTDKNAQIAFEFLIGGRVSVLPDSTVEIINERSAFGKSNKFGTAKLLLESGKAAVEILVPGEKPDTPIEIQTNGGTMGIRG